VKQDGQNNNSFPKIGPPATRALKAAGYSRLEQLTRITEVKLSQLILEKALKDLIKLQK
jgi:hypothetical protein